MHPTPAADRHLLCGVQARGGVPALSSPANGRHTTPSASVPLALATKDPSPMSSAESASAVHDSPRVRDWAARLVGRIAGRPGTTPSAAASARRSALPVSPRTRFRVRWRRD